MPKAVVFDLYETLITESGAAVPRAGALGESLGLDAAAFRAEWKNLRPLALRGQLTFKGTLMEIGARLGVLIPAGLLQRACDERVRAKVAPFQNIDPEMLAMTRELRERGVRLATISNCMAEDVVAWPGSALAAEFECAMFSFKVGMVKPDPRIYLDAIEQLGVSPGDALFIGDGGDDELTGAAEAGLRVAQAGWFVSKAAPAGVPVVANRQDVMRLVFQRSPLLES